MANPFFPIIVDGSIDAIGDGLINRYGRPFVFNGNLYIALAESVVFAGGGPMVVNVYKSVDRGQTWVALDSANGPVLQGNSSGSGTTFDGHHSMVCVYTASAPPVPVALQFQDFDLLTEKWGPVYGLSTDLWSFNFHELQCFVRPDGTRFVLSLFLATPGTVGQSGATAAQFDPGANAWSAQFDPGANIVALPNWDSTLMHLSAATAAMQSDGTLHWFFTVLSLPAGNVTHVWSNRCFYQQVLTDNSLGSFFDFPGQDAGTQDLLLPLNGGAPFGVPVILPIGALVLPVTRSIPFRTNLPYPTVYIGTPLSNPVWTEDSSTGGIDAAVQGGGTLPTSDLSLCPQTFMAGDSDSDQVTFSWVTADPTGIVNLARVRSSTLSFVAPTTPPWNPSTLFDMTVDPIPPGFYPLGGRVAQQLMIPGMSLFNGDQIILAIDAFDPASADPNNPIEARFWLGAFAPAPPVPSVRITLRGVKRRLCLPDKPIEEYRGRPPETHVKLAR